MRHERIEDIIRLDGSPRPLGECVLEQTVSLGLVPRQYVQALLHTLFRFLGVFASLSQGRVGQSCQGRPMGMSTKIRSASGCAWMTAAMVG